MRSNLKVLSLFDGASCGQLALKRAGIHFYDYYASEIKKHAIETSKLRFPNTIHLGDVREVCALDLPKIDLLIAGSPCQDFSVLKSDGKGIEGEKSKLFLEFLRLLKEVKPKYWLLENVRMKKEHRELIDNLLVVKGIDINSNLVSFQNRPRIYWTNIPGVSLPEDRGINFQDFKETDKTVLDKYKVNRTMSREKMWQNGVGVGSKTRGCRNVTHLDKIGCVTLKQDRAPNSGLIEHEDFCRYLTQKELELAQTVPVGYTSHLSYNKACDLLGDGWTIEVIAHIFKNLHSVI